MPNMTTVTLLFTDLVGSTELLDRLGDDAAETLRRRHFAILREAVTAQGGQEVKNLGDGLMVVFRSAVDAVACAVGMQRAIERYNAVERGPRLEVRVGLHVGEPIRDEDDFFGMPVVVAERLCGRAGAGQIIASEPVCELAARGDFAFRTLGALPLKGVAVPVPATLVRIVPDLADRVPDLPEPPHGDRESERYRMFESVVRVLAGASRRAPVLLVLDDLHWAAKPSLLLLRHLVRAGGSMSLLIVATYRDSDVHRGHPIADVLADLRREPAVERLSLDGLDAAGVAAFVATAAGHDLGPDEVALAQTSHRETEGNPFFLREILHHLFDAGVLDETSGRWRVQLNLA